MRRAGTDAELVGRFLGDRSEAAFRLLYRRHTPRLLQLCRRLLGASRSDAEDAVQEVWLRAADGMARFRGDSTLPTWLAGIAVNVCRELRRGRPAAAEIASADPEAAAGATPSTAPDAAATIALEAAIAALPEGYRQVLVLHDVEGYTHREAATLLGCEPGTSKSQLHHARRALRRALAAGPPR